jgi:hypothetical protein
LAQYNNIDVPSAAERFGFRANGTGGHMARSMMLEEISALIALTQVDTTREQYKRAILDENILGKPTFSSRSKSYRHLQELYGLDPSLALFRVFRQMSDRDKDGVPLMAMLTTFCRDPQLRHSFTLIRSLHVGEPLARARMEAHLETGFPGRFSAAMKKSLAQNVNTTWTGAGHLKGRVRKTRVLPEPTVAASTFAMFAGFLLGRRGEILIGSVFGCLVGASHTDLVSHLSAASARGWARFRHAGGVFEIDFAPLLLEHELEIVHGAR